MLEGKGENPLPSVLNRRWLVNVTLWNIMFLLDSNFVASSPDFGA